MQDNDAYERGEVPIRLSGWTQPQGLAIEWPALAADVAADVIVVGAGLAGASLALHLSETGLRVVVLEARQPGWGASGRNAGHVLPILRDMRVLERFPDQGKAFLELFREHHTIPFDLAAKYAIDCDAVRSGYINGMKSRRAFDVFMRKHAYLEAMGIQKLAKAGAADMLRLTGSRAYPYGVIFEDGGRINPYLFANGMAAQAVKLGTRVYGDTAARSISQEGARWRVRVDRGSVLADRVVFCTNAYPADIEPALQCAFHPLTAYALTTKPLPAAALELILPGGGTFSQAPFDLNPAVRDRHDRLILSSIPKVGGAGDAEWHFRSQLRWLHRAWPETRAMKIELDDYWTGRVALRGIEFPGVFDLGSGVYGLMYFNAWGNVMAPLMGKILAHALAKDDVSSSPVPFETPQPVSSPRKYERIIRHVLLPAARTLQRCGIL